MLSVILHATVVCLVCAGLVWSCRWVSRRSPLAGRVLAASLLIRASVAMFLFWTSFLGLPFLEHLQMGDGFWTIAPDAKEYFRLISLASTDWHYRDPEGRSLGYVVTLGLWVRAVGVNPASILLFNLVLSAAMVAAIVAAFGRFRDREAEWAAVASIAAFSFSPMLTFTSVQVLKDVFVVALVVAVVVADRTLLTFSSRRTTLRDCLVAGTVATVSIWLLTATRSYLAVLIWTATAAAYVSAALFAGRSMWPRYVVRGTAVLLVFGLAVFSGGDARPYPRMVREVLVDGATRAAHSWASRLQRITEPADETATSVSAPIATIDTPSAKSMPDRPLTPAAANLAATAPSPFGAKTAPPVATPPPVPMVTRGLQALDEARNGFTSSGGGTLLETMAEARARNRASALVSGLAATFVPMSILQRLSPMKTPHQSGLLILADADTLFLDLTIVVIGWILIRNRQHIDPGLAVLLVALAMLTILPMAYAVTNYGTLIRLRLMIAAPLWLLPLSIASGRRRRVSHAIEPSTDRANVAGTDGR